MKAARCPLGLAVSVTDELQERCSGGMWGRKPDSSGMRNENRPEMLTAYVLAVKRTRDGGGERCDHKAEGE